MWPSNGSLLAAGTFFLFFGTAAEGHTLSVVRGRIEVSDSRVILELTANAEDLLHERQLHSSRDVLIDVEDFKHAATDYGERLFDRLVIRGDDGRRLAGRMSSVSSGVIAHDSLEQAQLRDMSIKYSFEYTAPAEPAFLSLQQAVSGEPSSLPIHFLLSFLDRPGSERLFRLTDGGNVEILWLRRTHFDACHGAPSSRPCDVDRFAGKDALQSVRALIAIDSHEVRLDVFIPIKIAETWLPIPRAHEDFIEIGEQQRVATAVERLIAGRVRAEINGGTRLPHKKRTAFLLPGETTPAASARRVSAWTGRLRVSLVFESPVRPDQVIVHWGLFNSAVLTASARVIAQEGCSDYDLSTYQPRLAWRRTSNRTTGHPPFEAGSAR